MDDKLGIRLQGFGGEGAGRATLKNRKKEFGRLMTIGETLASWEVWYRVRLAEILREKTVACGEFPAISSIYCWPHSQMDRIKAGSKASAVVLLLLLPLCPSRRGTSISGRHLVMTWMPTCHTWVFRPIRADATAIQYMAASAADQQFAQAALCYVLLLQCQDGAAQDSKSRQGYTGIGLEALASRAEQLLAEHAGLQVGRDSVVQTATTASHPCRNMLLGLWYIAYPWSAAPA
eukprot:1160758-Pelagomonas_calceolata.AAC.11